jgi:hypothetical protein
MSQFTLGREMSENCQKIVTYYLNGPLARYCFIFWLKNPLAVDDDFWSLFVSIWIVMASAIINFAHWFLPGPRQLPYYLCADLDPTSDLVSISSTIYEQLLRSLIPKA